MLHRLLTVFLLCACVFLSGCFLFRQSLRDQLIELEMVPLPGGTYEIGDFYEGENQDALPIHPVTVAPFSISRYETTYAQYDAFAVATGRPLPDDDGRGRGNRAVANVSWYDADAFCQAYGYRLPTEIEWEYAARSGGKKELYAGVAPADSALIDEYVRYTGNTYQAASSIVGRRKPNGFGLYDMSGNVAEWIGDYYQFYVEPGETPEYADFEVFGIRLARGGDFNHAETIARTYWRTGTLAEITTFSIGFRCAQSAE